MLQAGLQQQTWRLDRTSGHDDETGVQSVDEAIGVDVLDAGGAPPVGEDAADVRLGHELRPTSRHGLGQECHGVALGVDGATEEGAEPAVVAGGAAVVGDGVGGGGCLVGVEPDALRRGGGQNCAVHGRPRGHGIGARTPGGEGVGALSAGDADGALDLGVVRLELVVVERPVDDVRAFLGPVGGPHPEVLLPEARHLAVGVRPAAPDGGRDGVDLPHVGVLALVGRAPEGTRLNQRVRPQEPASDELDLVVGVVRRGPGRIVGVEQVVAALLQDHDRPAGAGQHLGRGRPTRTRSDDDRVRRHGSGHLGIRVAARLDVAFVVDVLPAHSGPVAAVLGSAVHALAAVFPEQVEELLVGAQPAPLLLSLCHDEVVAQRGQRVAVSLLQSRRPVR